MLRNEEPDTGAGGHSVWLRIKPPKKQKVVLRWTCPKQST
jgi:hypothetical protein